MPHRPLGTHLHQMYRNCILPPAFHETEDMSQHLAKTLLDQAHLCPLPLPIAPIYWFAHTELRNTIRALHTLTRYFPIFSPRVRCCRSYDHALSLYPCPDALVLADSADHYRTRYYEVRALAAV